MLFQLYTLAVLLSGLCLTNYLVSRYLFASSLIGNVYFLLRSLCPFDANIMKHQARLGLVFGILAVLAVQAVAMYVRCSVRVYQTL